MMDRTGRSKSLRLLSSWLTKKQRWQLVVRSFFDVIGGATGKHYRIYDDRAVYNVEELCRCGKPRRTLCFQPEFTLPIGDVLLTQKLALELDELATLRLANKVGFVGGERPRDVCSLGCLCQGAPE